MRSEPCFIPAQSVARATYYIVGGDLTNKLTHQKQSAKQQQPNQQQITIKTLLSIHRDADHFRLSKFPLARRHKSPLALCHDGGTLFIHESFT